MQHRQTVTCTFTTQLFALVQVALREPLDLHWLHKVEFQLSKASSAEVLYFDWSFIFAFPLKQVLLGFGVLFIIFGVAGISIKWRKEWPTVPLSLRVGSPSDFRCVGGV